MKRSHESPKGEEGIEELARQLSELRQAVRKSNPLLKTVANSIAYPILALALGAFLSGVCIYVQLTGDLPNILVILILMFGASGGIKIAFTLSILRKHDSRGFYHLVRSIYGGKTGSLILGAGLAIGVGVVFLIGAGIPWYIIPSMGVFISFAAHALDIVIDLVEYRVLGWSSLIAGLAALFFVDKAPWAWAAVSLGLPFMLFGAAGIVRSLRAGRS